MGYYILWYIPVSLQQLVGKIVYMRNGKVNKWMGQKLGQQRLPADIGFALGLRSWRVER